MLIKQENRCYICEGVNHDRGLAIDHNHTTGKVRKLLCTKCNMALGYANDSPERLRQMADYIEEHNVS